MNRPEAAQGSRSAEEALSRNLKRGDGDEEGLGKSEAKEARRTLYKEAATLSLPIVSVSDKGGRTWLVGAGERGDSRMLFTKGDSSAGRSLRLAVDQLKKIAPLSDGSRFLDIGAEMGVTAVLAIQEHGFKDVIALEPNPGKYQLLCANAALNGVGDRVHAVQVEPKAGSPLVLRRGKRWCDYQPAAQKDAVAAIRKGKAVEVESASLDELTARDAIDPAAPALVRIAAREHPSAVMEGMRGSVRGTPLLLELDDRVLGDPESAAGLDAALAEHFERGTTLMSLSEDEAVAPGSIAELAGSDEPKTASVLALGD